MSCKTCKQVREAISAGKSDLVAAIQRVRTKPVARTRLAKARAKAKG